MVLIKQNPEDFYVEELIDIPVLEDNGEYTYFWLKKKNWTTVRALEQISNICRTSKKRFNFSGTKDKKAVTKQLVSAWRVPPKTLENAKLKDIEIEVVGQGNERINLGCHNANKFIIVVKNASELKKTEIFPKYFDLQRFGTNGLNHKIGLQILKGDFEAAAKLLIADSGFENNKESIRARSFAEKNWGSWQEILNQYPKFLGVEKSVLNHLVREPRDFAGALRKIHKKIRKMFIHAYQSHLFNSALSEYISQKYEHSKQDFLGETISFPDSEIKKSDLDFTFPLVGTDTKEIPEIMEKILEKDGISKYDFACRRMPELASYGEERTAFSSAKNLEIKKIKDAEYEVKFELGTGEYATMLIRQIFGEFELSQE